MTTRASNNREQWEALIVESAYWRRARDVDSTSPIIQFDREDLNLLDDGLQMEFRRLGGFAVPVRDVDRIDHPLARFYRLLYTNEFEGFREEVLHDFSGVAGMSKGVGELLLDQIFRYFVFVKESPVEARRFGQLICAIAVFRNSYDEDTKKFVENGIIKSRKHLFKKQTRIQHSRTGPQTDGQMEFESLDDVGIPALYESRIAQKVRELLQNPTVVPEVLDTNFFSSMNTDDMNITNPLSVSTAVYSPMRKHVLHLMQVLGLYTNPQAEVVDVIYTGTVSGDILQTIRDILPTGFRLFPTLDKLDANRATIIFLDEEADKEASAAPGDDNLFMQQVSILKGLHGAFRNKPQNLMAVSMNFRIPNVLTGPGKFEFPPGQIMLTPWKNPQDERMRLLWTPDMSPDPIEYQSSGISRARKMIDYVYRSLVRFSTNDPLEVESPGLIDGEFDSELERKIVKRFYDRFSIGSKAWMEVAPDDVGCSSPRFIGGEAMFGKLDVLDRLFKFVVDYHIGIPSNPLLPHAGRCARAGLFPTRNLAPSPLKESLNKIFGEDDSTNMYKAFLRVEEEKKNVILAIREKNIFPRIREKTTAFNIIRDLTPNFRDLVFFEPPAGRSRHNFMYDLFGRGEDDDRSVVLVHLGDSLGNTLFEAVDHLNYMNTRITQIVYEGSLVIQEYWKNISSDLIPFLRLKNAFSLKEHLESMRSSPFIIIRGHGYPQDIFESVIKSLEKTASYMGYVHVVDNQIIPVPRQRTMSATQVLGEVLEEAYREELRGRELNGMFIGSEHEFDLSFLKEKTFKRLFHVVESGAGGRRVLNMIKNLRRTIHKTFVQENLVSNFVPPLQDVKLDTIIVNQAVFSRIVVSQQGSRRFFEGVRELMGPYSSLIVLNFEEVWEYMRSHGKSVDGAGTVFSSPLISGHVNEKTFQVMGVSGARYLKSEVEALCRQHRLEMNVYNSSDFPLYEADRRQDDDHDLSPQGLSRMIKTMVIKRDVGYDRPTREEDTNAFEAYEGQAVDAGAQVRAYNNLVKRSLIEGVRDHTRVLDLACGHGQDVPKWFSHENIEVYVGMDASIRAIDEADNRVRMRKGFKPRITRMVSHDIFGAQDWVFSAEDFLRSKKRPSYTTISCQLAIHYAFKDEKTIKRFMYNVSNLLSEGGEFIVTTVDNQVLKQMLSTVNEIEAETSDEVHLRGEYFHIKMPSEMYQALMNNPIVMPGVSYEFTQFPSDSRSRTTTEYVVDTLYFQQLAEDMGLQLVDRSNFLNVSDTEDIDFSQERSRLTRDEREITSFYTTYRFIKVSDSRESMMEITPTLSLSDSMKQFERAMEILALGTAEKLGTFQRGLFLGPETIFPGPFVGNGYDRLDVITQDIGQVKGLYRQLKDRGRMTDREIVHLNRLPNTLASQSYDMIYLSNAHANQLESHLTRLSEGGSLFCTYVSLETADRVLSGDSEFANAVFELFVDRGSQRYSINGPLEESSLPLMNLASVAARVRELGLTLIPIPMESLQRDSKLSLPQRKFFSIFGMFRVEKTKSLEAPVIIPNDEQPDVQPNEPMGEKVDKFVLLPGLVQKKAPGKGRDETLASPGTLYKDLSRDTRWRFKLSDDWETEEFPVRMPSGETFSSVTNAMIYYKCQFSEEENKEYLGLNRSSGLPQPTDLKPFTKAIRGKRGQQWKERELEILRSVYEAKFTNTPNASDAPENLTPLRVLLLTREAHLYSNSRTRNELLENIRSVLQRIVGN